MKNLFRLLSYGKPYWVTIIISFVSSILYGIFNAASLWIVGTLIGTIFGLPISNSQDISGLNQKIDYFFTSLIQSSNQFDQLKMVCVCLFVTFFLKNIFFYINWVSLSFVQLNIIKDIRNIFYEYIQKFPLKFFDKNKTGELISVMLNDVNWISIAFNKSFHTFFHEIVSMLILFVMLFLISPSLTFIIILTVPISGFIIIKIGQSIRRKAKRASFKIADILSIVEEKIIGVKIVKAFNMSLKEINNFISNNFKFYNLQFKQQKLYGLTTPINDIIGVSLASLLLLYGGQMVLVDNYISPDDFMRFIIFLFAMLQPARKLGNSVASLQTGLASADRLFSTIDYPFESEDSSELVKIERLKESIKVSDLSFNYENNNEKALKNINITINKGEKVALIGRSGSGKTTFSNLLLKFYDPSTGSIFIDNLNYNQVDTTSLRDLIGLVTQEAILFNDTIFSNIAYGKINVDKKDVMNAAKTANIHDFVISLENGYDTIIGERGTLLSGGQKQRLSIARAILKNPEILIFDEATSSLDSESEQKVQLAISNLVKERTVIMIAHRLSTIKAADTILVFDKGEIVETGNHDKLLESNGLYKKLYKLQLEGNDE